MKKSLTTEQILAQKVREAVAQMSAAWNPSRSVGSGDGSVTRRDTSLQRAISALDRRLTSTAQAAKQSEQRVTPRPVVICGAKTRAGHPCKARAVEGKARCRMHGGLSTGPRSEAGRQAIIESNKRRAKRGNGLAVAQRTGART